MRPGLIFAAENYRYQCIKLNDGFNVPVSLQSFLRQAVCTFPTTKINAAL
jgi:hypothetical protein